MLAAWRDKLHNTNGGDNETELNEFAVKPTGRPMLSREVTMQTPVANCAKQLRKSRCENRGGDIGWIILNAI